MATKNDKISAVWVYWAGGADGDELRYSVRTVARHFRSLKNAVICGDVPDWFAGDAIDSPRFNGAAAKARFGSSRFCKWSDSIVKLQKIIDSPLVSERFLWLYDDSFFNRDLTATDLAVPRFTGGLLCANPYAKAPNKWREVMRRTAVCLIEAGYPQRNYSHHGPVVYEKAKLQETIDKFDPFQNPRTIESLYLNHHYADNPGQLVGTFLEYSKRPGKNWKPSPRCYVANVGTFNASVEAELYSRFPVACDLERYGITDQPADVPAMIETPDDSEPMPSAFGEAA